jgi:hypothetical protein
MINGVPRGRDLFLTGILFILADPSLADVDDNVSRSGPCPNKGHVLKLTRMCHVLVYIQCEVGRAN